MTLSLVQDLIGLLCGGLVGGGGAILAVPLMVYVVGLKDPHLAIGTSAAAVGVNALVNLIPHARRGSVVWSSALIFAAAGVVGAAIGSTLGKAFDGGKLLVLFAGLMVVVGVLMLRPRPNESGGRPGLDAQRIGKLVLSGAATGALSGFFGIGGGFLIVPALMASTGMPILYCVGTSLVSVAAFGLTTAVNYARSGLVDWAAAAVFVVGGMAGGFGGVALAHRLAGARGALNRVFAGLIFVVAAYVLYRGLRL
jgi:uncharacterized membrane protein YfcA